MDIYTVTFCTQDQDVGANFLWHTFLLLSRFDNETKKMEVVSTWGFYGSPSSNVGTIWHSIKMFFALDVDFHGNHGKLRPEDIRYLDAGRGLHGVTFELTKEKFIELQTKCEKMSENEFQAIRDLSEPLHLQGKPKHKTRNYPQENQSRQFFELESAAANEQQRSPRLKEFRLSLFPGANTCKAQAIKLLTGIVTPEQIARVTSWHGAVSRFSGKMEDIHLHSTGPLREHKKASGEIVRYRSHEDEDVRLFWSMPPQEVEVLSEETLGYFQVNPAYRDEIKKLVGQLQQFEWYFINASFDKKLEPLRETMLTAIQLHYQSFSMLSPKPVKHPERICSGKIMKWLFAPQMDASEKMLVEQIAALREFIERICAAMMMEFPGEALPQMNDEQMLQQNIELLARYLPEQKQRELCAIADINFDASKDDEYDLAL